MNPKCRYCKKELDPNNNFIIRNPDGTIRGYCCEKCAKTFEETKRMLK